MGDYRKLEVWQRARVMCIRVDKLIAKLPPHMRQSVRDQVGEAVESIRFNISEGCGLNSDPLLAKHLRIALGSANEAQDELSSLDEKGFVGAEDQDLIPEMSEIRAMTASFLATVLRDIEAAKARKRKARRTGNQKEGADG